MTSAAAERNLEIVRRGMSAMGAGDFEELHRYAEEVAHDEIEWVPLVTSVEGASYQGRDGLRRFFADFIGSFTVAYEISEVRALGEHAVLVLGAMKLRGRNSGVEIDQEMGVLWEFEDGLVRRGRVFGTQTEAVAAADALTKESV